MARWRDTRDPNLRPYRSSRVGSSWGAHGARRTFDRIVFQGSARVVCGEETWHAEAGDLSMGGVFLNMETPPAVGEEARVFLKLRFGVSLLLAGIVRWHQLQLRSAVPDQRNQLIDRRPAAVTEITELFDERAQILQALKASNWKVKGTGGAADRLGLKPSTLRSRMQRLGIARP